MSFGHNMRSHINNTIRACYAQLRPVAKIRRYLTTEAASKLCHAFITSRLDNMNSLLYKLPDYQIHRLQLVQNNTARLIKKLKRNSEDISDTLEELHWLPVEYRIKYKILLLMFKCHVQIAPSYLIDLTKPYIPGREGLRSSTQQLLDEGPKTQKTYGDQAFSMCGPKLWNKLPLELRQKCSVESFKKGLKTHLFKEAYNIWTVLTYPKNVFYKYFRLLYFTFMYICILYSFMYACKILAPVLFHSCIAHWAVWNCALKEFIIIIIIYNVLMSCSQVSV